MDLWGLWSSGRGESLSNWNVRLNQRFPGLVLQDQLCIPAFLLGEALPILLSASEIPADAVGLVVVECRSYVFFSDLGFPAQLLSEIYLNCLLALGTELSWTKGIRFGFQSHGFFRPLQ